MTEERLGRLRLACLGVAVFVAAATVPAVAVAFTTAYDPDYSRSFCIESVPTGITTQEAEALLNQAIAHWHAAPDQNDDQALELVRHADCDPQGQTTDFKIEAQEGVPVAGKAETDPAERRITFNTDFDWWDGTGSQGSKYSYEGVLVHEMGHAVGIGHAGDENWTWDGSELPTMSQCGDQADSATLDSIEQDDWGGAAWSRGGVHDFWSANPGFEAGFAHWYRSNSSQITSHSTYAFSGDLGVRMAASGNYVYITSVYDPWIKDIDGIGTAAGMSSNAQLHVRGLYRHADEADTGKLKAQYRTRILEYDLDLCKRDAFIKLWDWDDKKDMSPSCGDPDEDWTPCDRSVQVGTSQDFPGKVFRIYLRSTSSGPVWIDKVGAYGAASPP